MGIYCAIQNCRTNQLNCKALGRSLHTLPSNPSVRAKWLSLMKPHLNIASKKKLNRQDIKLVLHICNEHFTNNSFHTDFLGLAVKNIGGFGIYRRLKKDVEPTLFQTSRQLAGCEPVSSTGPAVQFQTDSYSDQTTMEPLHSLKSVNEFPDDSSLSYNNHLNTGTNDSTSTEVPPMKPPKKPITNKILPLNTSNIQAPVNELNNTSIMSSPKESEDHCGVIGQHVSIQLRQLPPKDRIDAIDEIRATLSKYREKVLHASIVNKLSNYYSRECSPSQSTVGLPPTSSPSTKTSGSSAGAGVQFQTGPSLDQTPMMESEGEGPAVSDRGGVIIDSSNVIFLMEDEDIKPDVSDLSRQGDMEDEDIKPDVSDLSRQSVLENSILKGVDQENDVKKENVEDGVTIKQEDIDYDSRSELNSEMNRTIEGNMSNQDLMNMAKCGTFANEEFDYADIHQKEITYQKNEKPIKKFSDKSFRESYTLKNHQRVHTKDKPFKCNYCDKTFSTSFSRNTHLSVHTDQKPFRCNYCEKAFSDSSNLSKHERRVHSDGNTPST